MKPKYLEKSFTRTLSFERQQQYAEIHLLKKQKEKQEKIKNDFMAFVKEMWPEFIEGRHHIQKLLTSLIRLHKAKSKD